jgi:hypothetical protein
MALLRHQIHQAAVGLLQTKTGFIGATHFIENGLQEHAVLLLLFL